MLCGPQRPPIGSSMFWQKKRDFMRTFFRLCEADFKFMWTSVPDLRAPKCQCHLYADFRNIVLILKKKNKTKKKILFLLFWAVPNCSKSCSGYLNLYKKFLVLLQYNFQSSSLSLSIYLVLLPESKFCKFFFFFCIKKKNVRDRLEQSLKKDLPFCRVTGTQSKSRLIKKAAGESNVNCFRSKMTLWFGNVSEKDTATTWLWI